MPLNCDCFPGCWGKHSVGWPYLEFASEVEHNAARAKLIEAKAVPYGSYVSVGLHLRVETVAHLEHLKGVLGLRPKQFIGLEDLHPHERDYVHQVMRELFAAREKFPTWPTHANDALAVVHEELGELQKDVLQVTYEPNKGKTLEHVRVEAVQTAAMALRFLFSLDKYTFTPGAQHTG